MQCQRDRNTHTQNATKNIVEDSIAGVGRGVWESTNKAVIADFFPTQPGAAFANVIWSSGLASSVGYFMFGQASMTIRAGAKICLFWCVLGFVGYLVACATSTKKQDSEDNGAQLTDVKGAKT